VRRTSLKTSIFAALGRSFAFITDLGFVDVRASVDGIGSFDAVNAASFDEDFDDLRIRLLSLQGLIACKRTMGRPQDLNLLPTLELMTEAEETRKRDLESGKSDGDEG
jgi:hypothetical protein